MEREINLVLQLATPALGAKSISFDFRRYAAMVRDLVMSREPQAMDSGEQFADLLSNLTVRANKALSQQNMFPPLGLLLLPDGTIRVILEISEESDLKQQVNKLQANVIQVARDADAQAACIAYPDYAQEEIVAFLENKEHYCAQYRIPVITEPKLEVDLQNLVEEKGAIMVFGE